MNPIPKDASLDEVAEGLRLFLGDWLDNNRLLAMVVTEASHDSKVECGEKDCPGHKAADCNVTFAGDQSLMARSIKVLIESMPVLSKLELLMFMTDEKALQTKLVNKTELSREEFEAEKQEAAATDDEILQADLIG